MPHRTLKLSHLPLTCHNFLLRSFKYLKKNRLKWSFCKDLQTHFKYWKLFTIPGFHTSITHAPIAFLFIRQRKSMCKGRMSHRNKNP